MDDLVQADSVLANIRLQEVLAGRAGGPDIQALLTSAQQSYDLGVVEQNGGDPAVGIQHFLDSWNSSIAARELQEELPNQAPEIFTAPFTEAIVGEEYVYDVDARDLDGGPLDYSLPTAPEGMAIGRGTGLITWVPDLSQAGEHAVEVLVKDGESLEGGLNDFQEFTVSVTVGPPNHAPHILDHPPVIQATVGEPYRYNVDAIDPNRDPVNYFLAIGPEGMTIEQETGVVSWVPDASQVGDHVVQVVATDGESLEGGLNDTTTYTVSVRPFADTPEAVVYRSLDALPDTFVDQFFDAVDPGKPARASLNVGSRYIGQSFRAGVTGTLVGVSLKLSPNKYAEAPPRITIRRVVDWNGIPHDDILSEAMVTSWPTELSDIILLPTPVEVVAGERYVIVVDHPGASKDGNTTSQGTWEGSKTTRYRQGSYFRGGGHRITNPSMSPGGIDWIMSKDLALWFRTHMKK